MKVTIKDVAKEANVSASTVSRVLSNNSKISEKTKENVWEAIKKLNYTPNEMARGLATQRTNILTVALPQDFGQSFSNPFFMQVLKGISTVAKNRGYFIMYAFKEEGDSWINRFIQSNFVQGIILFHEENEEDTINYLKEIDFPFVSIGLPKDVDSLLKIDSEQYREIHEANGRYIGSFATKTIIEKLENKGEKNYKILNIKFVEKESAFDKMKGMILYNRKL